MEAYWKSREIFALLGSLLAPLLSMTVEETSIEVAGEVVRVHALFPADAAKAPLVLATNGLEGTVQELVVPLLRYRRSGMGMVVMEMPGSYASAVTMAQGENIYNAVIDHFRSDPRVDPARIGMVGVSFGGYWSTRMAAVNPNLACAVACGAPVHHTFTPTGSLGVPEVIVSALMKVTGTRNPASLLHALRRMSLLRNGLLDRIHIPLLVINGENDTLISPRDAPLLAARVPHAELQLYPGDDHCAMGHYREWMDQSFAWISTHLADSSAAKDRNGSL